MAQQQPTPLTITKYEPLTIVKAEPLTTEAEGSQPFNPPRLIRAAETAGRTISDLAIGAAKGVGSTILGGAELINRALGTNRNTDWNAARQDLTTPTNTAQSIGKGVEQAAEFFVPGGAVKNTVTALGKLKAAQVAGKAGQVALRAGAEGVAGAAVHSAQTGSTEGAKAVGLTGAMAALGTPVAGKALKILGEKVESALIKASTRDYQNGFKPGTVFKYGLGGSLETTLKKSDAKLADLSGQLRAELASAGPGLRVDVHQILNDAEAQLTRAGAKTWGSNSNIAKAFERLRTDPEYIKKSTGGFTDLVTAQELKQAMGELGAWKYGMRDPDSDAMEKVANLVYTKLKTAIEKAAPNPGRIKELNGAMSEIIPVRQAIIRRLPVEERQNPIGLLDALGLASGRWWVGLLNRGLRSGQAADVMVRAGERGSSLPVGTATAAGTSQIIR